MGDYVIEGHVPASAIKRLLREKPAVAGLSVPGMPLGSPGMEVPGKKDAYDVVAFDKAGKIAVFKAIAEFSTRKSIMKKLFPIVLLINHSVHAVAAEDIPGKGVINRVDAAAGVVNINHEPIATLKWPAMSMDFKVADKRQLVPLKAGQTVSFGLTKDAAQGYVISRIDVLNAAK